MARSHKDLNFNAILEGIGSFSKEFTGRLAAETMREDAVNAYFKKADGHFSSIEKLLNEKKIFVSTYNDERFYLRTLTDH